MTKSELKITNYAIEYFFKEFVYKNLYFHDGKDKKELCDALIDFQDTYIIIQIKEKKDSKSNEWLQKKVYKKAVSQIKDTLQMLKSGICIEVESYTGEHITISSEKKILSMIIFDSDDTKYKQIHTSTTQHDLHINVFSIEDFKQVLDSLIVPYDIVSYLEMRATFFTDNLPDFFINNINDELATFSRIKDERGLLEYFLALISGNKYIDLQALDNFQYIIKNFSDHLMTDNQNNSLNCKEILKNLINSDRNTVYEFMLRWQVCVEHCMNKEDTITHFLINSSTNVGYLFLTELQIMDEHDFIDVLVRTFKYNFKLKTAIGVIFNMVNKDDYSVEWVKLTYDEQHNDTYEKLLEEDNPWSNKKRV